MNTGERDHLSPGDKVRLDPPELLTPDKRPVQVWQSKASRFEGVVAEIIRAAIQPEHRIKAVASLRDDPPTSAEEFRTLLRMIREQSGVTFGQLAQSTAWSRSALHKATATGPSVPSEPLVRDLLRGCKVPQPLLPVLLGIRARLDWGAETKKQQSSSPADTAAPDGGRDPSPAIQAYEIIAKPPPHGHSSKISMGSEPSERGSFLAGLEGAVRDPGTTKRVVLLILLMVLLTAGGTAGVVVLASIVPPVIALTAPLIVGMTLILLALAAFYLVNAFPAQRPHRGGSPTRHDEDH